MTSRDPNHDRLSHGNEKFQRIRTADTPSDWIALMAIAVRRKCDMAQLPIVARALSEARFKLGV
jgi:hypothetical protein